MDAGYPACLVRIARRFAFSAIAILGFEADADSANIRSPEDALWWAVTTITTVGYGDRFPVTTEGRIIAAVLMTAGVGLFGTLSGVVAAWFLAPTESDIARSDESSEVVRLRKAVEDLNASVTELRARQ